MVDFAIRVTHLSKSYRVGVREQKPRTLIGRVANLIQQPLQNLRRIRRLATYNDKAVEADDLIWALRDVSLEIQHGEVVGIIGHNGAGKSTLLKILSRITYPTSGYADVSGRISSLLEVGTGFHLELTGRENVYMNGTLLGMTRTEINRKFDEIVDFSGVEKFIDTPVKHYSSGMRVRLAFAVAAHLEAEILLVDEVLAVGDAEFQKKCLGKLSTVADSGRTVLFVSHNMAAMQNLCSRGIWLDHGTVCQVGGMTEVAENYLRRTQAQPQGEYLDLSQHAGRRANSPSLIKGIQLRNGRTGENIFYPDDPLDILISVATSEPIERPTISITIGHLVGVPLFSLGTNFSDIELPTIQGASVIKLSLGKVPLLPGTYYLNIGFGSVGNPLMDAIFQAAIFDIVSDGSISIDYKLNPTTHGALRFQDWHVVIEDTVP